MRDRKLVEFVQQLHIAGYKNSEIVKKVHKSSSHISRWCRKLTAEESLRNPKTYKERIRKQYFEYEKINLCTLDKNLAKILLGALYWCEGAKYPGSSRIEFVSSDEKMQELFILLLRYAFATEIDERKFRVILQLHTTHNIEQSITYWSKILRIPKAQFIKPHITIGKSTRYRHTYNGTCGLRYNDYKLLLRIMGVYDQLTNRINSLLI